jgi:hypothetical protein
VALAAQIRGLWEVAQNLEPKGDLQLSRQVLAAEHLIEKEKPSLNIKEIYT